ncbi:hypothetical protein CMO96_04945 [Candidatus Woesebacteria bacterium]|nr:hypothetical protein [Candidatus Woesebacteria bacterium]|tara:strand:+ start:576 stop:806 length:231 start_codon:yes stop_codon:yes gene_type:complete
MLGLETIIPESTIWFLVKILFLVGLLVYLVFAAVVVRQVHLMTSTLQVGVELPVKSIAWIHMFVAIGVFLLALLTL